MAGKPKKLETRVIDGLEVQGKSCKICSEWKPLSSFHKSKSYTCGHITRCKECVSKDRKEYCRKHKADIREYNKRYYEQNKESVIARVKCYEENNQEKLKEYRRKRYMSDREKFLQKAKEHAKQNQIKLKAYSKAYFKNNKIRYRLYDHRARSRKEELPSTLTLDETNKIFEYFEHSCALTGSKEDVHLDHVIPISIGHGGTTVKNIIPLHSTLNLSKFNNNIFEWFKSNSERFNLSQDKFDSLITYLADLNEMTSGEYEDYVYKCFERDGGE